MSLLRASLLVALLVGAASPVSAGERKTVCTITVNSADEKETFRERLPKGQYQFVELVEKGRPDWLRSSCQRGVQCDVLVVSGHFNAGDTFYSDRLENNEYLEVDELERASCSASCPNLFGKLKEVYLFGCESLNPDASRYASAYGESGRERMRRMFPNVPVIYGFSSSAPVGPTAAMLLRRYFDGGAGAELGSGRPSARLLKVFGRNSMTHVAGVKPGEPLAAQRAQVCGFFDERKSPAQKVAHVHRILRGEAGNPNAYLKRVERLLASFTPEEKSHPDFAQALAVISADEAARERFMSATRRAGQPGTRAGMIDLAATLGWLPPDEQRMERVALINDMLAAPGMGFAEVDLVCTLNADRSLDAHLAQVRVPAARATRASHQAALACLGSDEAHGRIVQALASRDAADVQVAQAYLRHRPQVQGGALRQVANDITRLPDAGAQARALDALARLNISDRAILEDLSRAFAEAKSHNVQRAIAEVFIRSDPKALPKRELLSTLREHRLKPPGGGTDLVDVLISRLSG
jgi:hypothetical protein